MSVPGRFSRAQGFTLIEVLVVVVIIAVATAAGMTLLRPTHDDLNINGRHLASWLDRLAMEARLSGLPTAWRCDGESSQRILFEQQVLETQGGARWKPWGEKADWLLPAGVRLHSLPTGGVPADCRQRRVLPPFGVGERWSFDLHATDGARLTIAGDGFGRIVVTPIPSEGT